MKTMTCRQLGGACDLAFHAETFDDMAKLSQLHGKEMLEATDDAHLAAMSDMRKLMETPDAMSGWFDEKRREFDTLPSDS